MEASPLLSDYTYCNAPWDQTAGGTTQA